MLQLYENIRKRRIELGLSQQELAERVGYKSGKSMIAKIESGLVDLSAPKISRFAEALLTNSSTLMGWDEPPQAFKNKDELNDIVDGYIIEGSNGEFSMKSNSLDNLLKLVDRTTDISVENREKIKNYINKLMAIQKIENEVE